MNMVGVASLFLAVAAAGLALDAGWTRCRHQGAGSDNRALHPWRWMVLGLMLLAGSMFVNLLAWGASQEASKSWVSVANLRTLDCASRTYTEEVGVYPSALEPLIHKGFMSPGMFWSIGDDRDRRELIDEDPDAYSSYGFRPLHTTDPGFEDPDLVVAYERKPFKKPGGYILSEYKHAVLFADRRTTFLDEQELRDALARDRERRRQLGWPEQPATTSPRD